MVKQKTAVLILAVLGFLFLLIFIFQSRDTQGQAQNAIVRVLSADKLLTERRFNEAFEIYSDVLIEHPRLTNALSGRAKAAWELKEYSTCIDDIDLIESIMPNLITPELARIREQSEANLSAQE